MTKTPYTRRLLDPLVESLLTELPAVLLVGPRATGKTTTAARHARTTVRLDREAEAAAFRADPDSALAALREPVLIDEWQMVPETLGAIKRAVDQDPSPGRFLLTGSVRGDLNSQTWPGTGRIVRLQLLGMTVAEQRGLSDDHRPFLDRVASGDPIPSPTDPLSLSDYVELALTGGFPQAMRASTARVRDRWLASYVDQLVTRDAAMLSGSRDPERLRRFFEGYALNSAGVVADKTLFETAQINRKTADAYEQLFKNLFVIESVPAWTSNRILRLVKSPKRFLVDPAFLGALLRLDVPAVIRDGNLLGRLLDTFVTAQLRAELEVCDCRPRLYHLRREDGRQEIDLLVELGGGRIIGIEIKATAAPTKADARHLEWLQSTLPEQFVAGIVFHTGPQVMKLSANVLALPICTLWK